VPPSAYANGAGLPQFFKINGKAPTVNPLQFYGITAQSFLIPQDIAPEKYLVNQPIHFEIETSPLLTVIPEPLLKKTTYTWNFGDGTKAEGLINTHTYTQMGSYILTIIFNVYTDDNQPPTQFIDSFLLHIVPNKNFSDFPQAVIQVNGKPANTDPKYNLVKLDFQKPVTFDASLSKSQSGKITAYFWNFGDGQSSTAIQQTHTYGTRDFAAVVLRVKDSNGFISDSFVGIRESTETTQNPSTSIKLNNITTYLLAIAGIVCMSIGVFYLLTKH
jgi:hypothetical protein